MTAIPVGMHVDPKPVGRRVSRFAVVVAACAVLSFPVIPAILVMMVVGALLGPEQVPKDPVLFPYLIGLDGIVLGLSIVAFARVRRRRSLDTFANFGLGLFAIFVSATWVALPVLVWGINEIGKRL